MRSLFAAVHEVSSWPEAADRIFTADCRFRGEADIDGFWRVLDLSRMTHLRHPGNAKLNRLFGAGEHSGQVDGKALEAVLL